MQSKSTNTVKLNPNVVQAQNSHYSINQKSSTALNPQKKVGTFDFPFTLNPYIGCEMGCSYCFVPQIVIRRSRNNFFHNVEVKANLAELLKKELKKYSTLPQHLKRVQIGVTTELFQPKVINFAEKELEQDPISEILKIFYDEDQKGNHWMLHLLTKNHNVVSYLEQLKLMKHMVQVELSIITLNETISRRYEKFTSSIKRRLDTIEKLAAEGIFTRVMAMPFYGDRENLIELKNEVFEKGAAAFKNKSLNYYDWENLDCTKLSDELSRTKSKTDDFESGLLIRSGEKIVPAEEVEVLLPKERKRGEKFINWANNPEEGLELRSPSAVDLGYRMISKINYKNLR